MDKLINTKELADLLGLKEQTIRIYVSGKRIPFTKIYSSVRFTPEQVNEIINRGRVEAIR